MKLLRLAVFGVFCVVSFPFLVADAALRGQDPFEALVSVGLTLYWAFMDVVDD